MLLAAAALPRPAQAQTPEELSALEAIAQTPPGELDPADLPSDLSPAMVQALLARLSDQQVRDLLLSSLEARAQPAQADADTSSMISGAEAQIAQVRHHIATVLGATPQVFLVPGRIISIVQEDAPASVWLLVIGAMLLMAAAGAAFEWAARWLFRGYRKRIETYDADDVFGKLGLLLVRLILDWLCVIAAAVGALAVFFLLWQGHEPTRDLTITVLAIVIVSRLLAAFIRFLFAPARSDLRLYDLEDKPARFVNDRVRLFFVGGAIIVLFCDLLLLLGISGPEHVLINLLGITLLLVLGIDTIWRAKPMISPAIAASGTRTSKLIADAWPAVFTALLLVFYLTAAARSFTVRLPEQGLGGALPTILLLATIPIIDKLVRATFDTLFPPPERAFPLSPKDQERRRYRQISVRASRLAIWLVALIVIAGFYRINPFDSAKVGLGEEVIDALFSVGLIVLVSYVLWQVVKTYIDRRIAEESPGAGHDGEAGDMGSTGLSRVATLLPLARVAIQITIVVMTAMIALSALGVNIGPLLAGAGVVGLAVGFGAQTLVRDIVSGVFFLVDDAFRIGEYIDVGDVKGTVEKISVRSLRLRHHRGALNTIPFGEITHLTNYSRDWVIMKLEFRVPHDTDVNKVRRIFKLIGKDLLNHPEIGNDFLQPFKSQGVSEIDETSMIIRGKFMAKPGRQFLARREIYNAVLEAFEVNGIQFANRQQVRVKVDDDGSDDNGQAATKGQVAGAAARQVIEPAQPVSE
ncbi:MAG: mechanosensitive ion channel family protein [Geminicoccaceae bacterium]